MSNSSGSEYNLDHKEEVVRDMDRTIPSRHRSQPRLQAIIKGFGDAVQELETLIYNYLTSGTLQLATGDQLDFWGELVGSPRGPFNDGVYRELIKSRAMVNVSDNTIDDIIELYRAATGAKKVWYYGHYPAGFRLEALRGEFMSDDRAGRVFYQMDLAVSGGVDYTLVETVPENLRLSHQNGFGSTFSRVIDEPTR